MTTAKQIQQLLLLGTELSIAQGAYANRRHDADHLALKRAATLARLRYRSFFRAYAGDAWPY